MYRQARTQRLPPPQSWRNPGANGLGKAESARPCFKQHIIHEGECQHTYCPHVAYILCMKSSCKAYAIGRLAPRSRKQWSCIALAQLGCHFDEVQEVMSAATLTALRSLLLRPTYCRAARSTSLPHCGTCMHTLSSDKLTLISCSRAILQSRLCLEQCTSHHQSVLEVKRLGWKYKGMSHCLLRI